MIRFHHDVKIFRQAVSITQLRTGFAERLIEKDYFCSVHQRLDAGDENVYSLALRFECSASQIAGLKAYRSQWRMDRLTTKLHSPFRPSHAR
jgi:hypothetical protein